MQKAIAPSSRPTRTAPSPPLRPSVRSMFRRPRRASSTAQSPSTADAAVATAAWNRVTCSYRRAAKKARGGTASASNASRTEPRAASFRARSLLLLVRPSNGCRRDRSADHAGDGDQREDVRQRLEERGRIRRVDREPEGERGGEAEEECRAECAERPPVPEDQRRERDEPAAGGHVLVVGVQVPDREVGAAHGGEDPREDDGAVANEVDVDP